MVEKISTERVDDLNIVARLFFFFYWLLKADRDTFEGASAERAR